MSEEIQHQVFVRQSLDGLFRWVRVDADGAAVSQSAGGGWVLARAAISNAEEINPGLPIIGPAAD